MIGSSTKSGSLSHAYVEYPPLACSISDPKKFFYDDGNKLLLCVTANQVYSWKINPFDSHNSPVSDAINEGSIISLRYSLDLKILAVQRSHHEIHFLNREERETFIWKCRHESETIMGLFWTDCSMCDLVVVKSSGLDLFSCDLELKSLRLVESKKLNVSWYSYTHESRLVLLASGVQCTVFNGFQLSSAGIVRLPRFDMNAPAAERNSKPVLSHEDVHIVTLYGRIYCIAVDRTGMKLDLYRFYRDAVVEQGSLPMYSARIGVSVVDSVLLVHQVDAGVVVLYDLYVDCRVPVTSPLPIALRRGPSSGAVYGDGVIFLTPDLVLDTRGGGSVCRIRVDLEAVSASSSDLSPMLEFMQRRKHDAAKTLSIGMVRTAIAQGRPISVVGRAMDVMVASYSHASPKREASAAVSLDEMYSCLFLPLADEGAPCRHLVSAILEFLRSSNAENLRVPSPVHTLLVDLLVRGRRFSQLQFFVMNKIVEHSKEVALRLLQLGSSDEGGAGMRSLGFDMLRQLSLHCDYIHALLRHGYYLEALRYAHSNKIEDVQPAAFLDAVFASNDSQHLAAVLLMMIDIIPGFTNTPDFMRFSHILHDMNYSPVALRY